MLTFSSTFLLCLRDWTTELLERVQCCGVNLQVSVPYSGLSDHDITCQRAEASVQDRFSPSHKSLSLRAALITCLHMQVIFIPWSEYCTLYTARCLTILFILLDSLPAYVFRLPWDLVRTLSPLSCLFCSRDASCLFVCGEKLVAVREVTWVVQIWQKVVWGLSGGGFAYFCMV